MFMKKKEAVPEGALTWESQIHDTDEQQSHAETRWC